MRTVENLIAEAYSHWDDPKTLFVTGRELHDRNRLPHARRILARAVELDPNVDADAWSYLSFAHFRDFDAEGGEDALRRGIEATGSEALKSTLANFTGNPEEAARLREEIRDCEDAGVRASILSHEFYSGEDPAGALAKLRDFAAEHPGVEDVEENLMWVLLSAKARNVEEDLDLRETGVPLADKTIAADPDRVFGHWIKLQMLILEKDWDAVLAATSDALARFPDDETMMQFRGRAYREAGNDDRAMDWFSRAIGAKPSFAGARVDLAKIHEKHGRMDLAEEIFREIPVANPDYAAGPVSIALFLARQERWDEAEALFLETWPKLPAWYRGGLRNNPDFKPLLEREAVKSVVEPKDTDTHE